jgi:hypothetical protein
MGATALLLVVVSIAAPQAGSKPTGHRLQIVHATDGTPVGGAELFDFNYDWRAPNVGIRRSMFVTPDRDFPPRARRHVADGDGFVEIGPGRLHALYARAPGCFQLYRIVDLDRTTKVELLPDEPLTIEIRDAHDGPAGGIFVELRTFEACDSGPHSNSDWRVASDGNGRVSFPHYRWWRSDDAVLGRQRLEPTIPLRDPPGFELVPLAGRPTRGGGAALADPPAPIVWRLPPLSKVHVEFAAKEELQEPLVATFELIGPREIFGRPDRFTSRDGAAIDVPAEIGVPLQARFQWEDDDVATGRAPEHFALGRADPCEGGVATLRVCVANDPVALHFRPLRGDGAPPASIADVRTRVTFSASVEWKDSRGFAWRDLFDRLAPDETGAVRFVWRCPRLATEPPPATIHVALRPSWTRYGWEPLHETELASRDLPWPTGAELDVGTLIVPTDR